jgi:hypothetical protein
MSRLPAAAAGPRPCSVCAVPLQACWPFRPDDRHCPLCGLHILRLAVFPIAPDGNVWLYQDPDGDTAFRLVGERGPEGKPDRRQLLRPQLDLTRSAARFGGELLTGLEFDLEEIDNPGGTPEMVTVRLATRFGSFDAMPLPSQGVPGHLVLATSAGDETRGAVLLPPPGEPVLECPDPSIPFENGVWQLYQKEGPPTFPLTLTVPVAQWALGVNVPPGQGVPGDVSVRGFEAPVLLEPGKPHAFELRLADAGWDNPQPRELNLLVRRAALAPQSLTVRFALIAGSRLQFVGGSPRAVEVRLGRRVPLPLLLSVTSPPAPALPPPPPAPDVALDDEVIPLELALDDEGEPLPAFDAPPEPARAAPLPEAESGLTVIDYTVHQTLGTGPAAEGEEWLRVLRPTREQLPWHLPPTGAGQPPDQLDLEIDTTRLDRDRYAGAVLRGAVELTDSRRRRWRCEVHASVGRAQRLASWVAFDWGTTNSCAAYRRGINPGEPPLSIPFDQEQQQTPELFPSDIYFEDLSDPRNPVFHLGHDAARQAREHPECCLRSVKRKFQFQERVFVMDERQRGHAYTTAELARLMLRKLIALAEEALGQEIHQLGLTFPTKWSARVRHKLEDVTRALQAELEAERKPFRVTILPPTIDEANAVAINLITSEHDREDLPENFYLVAYDFGGGTVDTSVLEVRLPPDMTRASTHYIGLGGRGDFGGDDVTRAVMTLLRDRIADALQRRVITLDPLTGRSARLLQMPLVADGEPLRAGRGAAHLHQLGRKNWDALWKIAELIKIDLCDAADASLAATRAGHPTRPPSAGDTDFGSSLAQSLEEDEHLRQLADDRHAVMERLRPRLAEIACRVLIQPGPGEAALPAEDEWALDVVLDPLDADDRDAFFRELRFTLDEACDYPLEDIFETNAGQRYSVRQRVEDTVRELRAQCDDRKINPNIIVLAGGGSRLPLVARLMRHHFPSDRDLLHYDRAFAKRRVAHGMASYLALRQVVNLDPQLARSVDVLHHPLGLQVLVIEKRRARTDFLTVVPVGAPLNNPAVEHPVRFAGSQLLNTPEGGRRLVLFVRDWRSGPVELGHFEVSGPSLRGAGRSAPLPAAPAAAFEGVLRLHGARRVELTVTHEGARYGPFPLVHTVHDPEAALQSEDPLAAGRAATHGGGAGRGA